MDRKTKEKKNESNMQDLWNNIKCTNLLIIEVQEKTERERERGREGEREQRIENVFEESMAENLPNLKKKTDIQIQETQRAPNKMNANRPTPRYIIIKMAIIKDKKKILKATREKQRIIQGYPNKAMS